MCEPLSIERHQPSDHVPLIEVLADMRATRGTHGLRRRRVWRPVIMRRRAPSECPVTHGVAATRNPQPAGRGGTPFLEERRSTYRP